MLLEPLECRLLLATFGTDWTYIPATTAARVFTCQAGACLSAQGVAGGNNHIYKFFADDDTQYEVRYADGDSQKFDPVDPGGATRLITWNIDRGKPFEGTVFNAGVPQLKVLSQWDERLGDNEFGPFLYSVERTNQFKISFQPALPADLQVQYRWHDEKEWQAKTVFDRDISTFKPGKTYLDVRILDPEDRLFFQYDLAYSVLTLDALPVSMRWRGEFDSIAAENARFIQDVDAGSWSLHVSASYLPTPAAYADYEFAVAFADPQATTHVQFVIPFATTSTTGNKLSATASPIFVGTAFDDLVPGGVDYVARIVAKPPAENLGGTLINKEYGKPFSSTTPIETTRLPSWMDAAPADVAYQFLSEAFAPGKDGYLINIDTFKFSQEFPTTANTPFGLFDGRETYLVTELDLKAYVPIDYRIRPKVLAKEWKVKAELIGNKLTNFSGSVFPKSGITVSGELNPRTLGLEGGGISLVTSKLPLFGNKLFRNQKIKGFNVALPIVATGGVALDARLKVDGFFESLFDDLSVQAGIQLIEQNGSVLFGREGTFVRLNVDALGRMEIDGKGSLGLQLGITPPPGLSDEQKELIEKFRVELIQAVFKGIGTANIAGKVQANFFGPILSADYDFEETLLTLNGRIQLKYNACFAGDTVRSFFGLKPCDDETLLEPLMDYSVGPKVILGGDPEEPDPNDPDSYDLSGDNVDAGDDVGAESEQLPPLAQSGNVGSIKFRQPFDQRLQRVDYQFTAQATTATLQSEKYFLETLATAGDDRRILKRTDLSTLTYTNLKATALESVTIEPGTLSEGQSFQIEFRLVVTDDAPAESVNIRITSLQTRLAGPQIRLESAVGSLTDDALDFGPDSGGGTIARVLIHNDAPLPLTVESVEVIGDGFALIDPPVWSKTILDEQHQTYRVRVLDRTRAASGTLRIRSDDPNNPVRELTLRYSGTPPLTASGPRVTTAALGSSSAAGDVTLPFSTSTTTVTQTDRNQIRLTFNKPVEIRSDMLRIAAPQQTELKIIDFGYDEPSRTAVWTLDAPLRNGGVLITLLDRVTDQLGNRLDGEIRNSSTSSGNDVAGGILQLRLNVQSLGSSSTPLPATPKLNAIDNRAYEEGTLFEVTAKASEGRTGAGVVYALVEGPAYSSIDPTNGVLQWQPPEEYLPGRYRFTVEAGDGLAQGLASYQSFEVNLIKTNRAPELLPLGPQTIRQRDTLRMYVEATDTDYPAQRLTYHLLDSAPVGAVIDLHSGEFSWTPASDLPPGEYSLPIEVRDNGSPVQTSTMVVPVTVVTRNTPPRFGVLPSPSGQEDVELTFTLTASDIDSPTPMLRLGDGKPVGATMDPLTGIFKWTPSEVDGGRAHAIYLEAVDARDASLVSRTTILVQVAEVNTVPELIFPSSAELTVPPGTPVNFTVGIIDPDVPTRFKEYYLRDNAIDEARLDILSGQFQWTPTAAGMYPFTLEVVDYDFERTVRKSAEFIITVTPDTIAPSVELTVISPTQSPLAFVELSDNVGVVDLQARFIAPSTSFVPVEMDPFTTVLTTNQLLEILGTDFEAGDYTVEVAATDAAGNRTTARKTFTIDFTEPAPAQLSLDPAFDTVPVGDSRTQTESVNIVAQVEPRGRVSLTPRFYDVNALQDPPVYVASADESGRAVVENVALTSFGKNTFDVQTFDSAGNAAFSTFAISRLTTNGLTVPDGYGYKATRTSPGFTSIAATGSRIFDDGFTTSTELTTADLPGFSFDFYGETYESIHLGLFGILSFGQAVSETPNSFLTDAAAIAPYWAVADVINPTDGVYWRWAPLTGGGRLTVQWQTVTSAEIETVNGIEFIEIPVRFQVVLDTRDHSIEFHYDSLDPLRRVNVERSEFVFLKAAGVQEPSDAAIVISSGSAPYDLVDNQTSLRITATAEPFAPLLRATFTVGFDFFTGETIAEFPIVGRTLDASGITSLRLEFIGSGLPAIDVFGFVQTDGQFVLEQTDIETLLGSAVPEGDNVIRITATDGAGQSSIVDLTLSIDTVAPTLLRFELGLESHGRIIGDFETDREKVSIVGMTEPFVFVTLTRSDGSTSVAEADELGKFEVFDVGLELGDNVFDVTLTDSHQNESSVMRTIRRIDQRSFGPDAFGYRATSIPINFTNISSNGQKVLVGTDDAIFTLGPSELGDFVFFFYGRAYDSIRVTSNGTILLGDVEEFSSEEFFLEFSPRNAAIVPLGDDLIVSGAPDSGVYWKLQADGSLVIQWHNVTFDGGNSQTITFQIVLRPMDASIEFHYLDLNTGDLFDGGIESAIGIKASGDQDVSRNVLELTSFGSQSEFFGTGKAIRFARERLELGAAHVILPDSTPVRQGSLAAFEVHFDRAMDRSSFSLSADVISFTSPTGEDLRAQLSGFKWLDAQTLLITTVPQHADGAYTLRLKPTINSAADGTLIDQDRDQTAGEAVEDAVTIKLVLQNCVTATDAIYRACAVTAEQLLLTKAQSGVFVIYDSGDDESQAIDLQDYRLRLYDRTVTGSDSMFVSINGLITVGQGIVDFDPTDLSSSPSPLTIAPLWSDWIADPDQDDLVLGVIQTNRGAGLADRLIIQWQVFNFSNSPGFDPSTAVFQAIFDLNTDEPSRIVFQYPHLALLNSLQGNAFPATVGMKHADGNAIPPLVIAQPSATSHLIAQGAAIELTTELPSAMFVLDQSQRTSPLLQIPLKFTDDVVGVDPTDLLWKRDGTNLSLTGAQITGAGSSYVVNLPAGVQTLGEYQLSLIDNDTITASNGRMLYGTATIEYTIHPPNTAPTSIQLSSQFVPAYKLGAIVGDLAVTDGEVGQTYEWTISDPRFMVDGTRLRLVPDVFVDFTREQTIAFDISVTDSGYPAESYTQTIELAVVDGPRIPKAVLLVNARTSERISGAKIGRLSTGNAEESSHLQFSTTDPRFTISNGILSLKEEHFLRLADASAVELIVTATRFDAGEFSASRSIIITLDANPFPWQNPTNRFDSNRNRAVSSLDALLIMNRLSQLGTAAALPDARPASTLLAYFDVTGDGKISSLDALQIINALLLASNATAEAEVVSQNVTRPRSGPSATIASIQPNRFLPNDDDQLSKDEYVHVIDEVFATENFLLDVESIDLNGFSEEADNESAHRRLDSRLSTWPELLSASAALDPVEGGFKRSTNS